MFSPRLLFLLLLASGGWLLPSLPAQDRVSIEISASFNPPILRLGQEGRYTLLLRHTLQGSGGFSSRTPTPPSPPLVDGLELDFLGQSSSTQTTFSNLTGTTRTLEISLNYRVRPTRTGRFTLPAFPFAYEGQSREVPPAGLEVIESTAEQKLAEERMLFLELELPAEKWFIGQTLRANLQLFALDRIPNLRTNVPVKEGDAFAEGKLADNQTRSRGTRDNFSYNVYSRPLTLTPLKAGTHPLAYTMEVQALLPLSGDLFDTPPATPSDPLFSDPFFQRFNLPFSSQMQYENRLLSTPPREILVHPLPDAGRPPEFTGAIGSFNLQAFAAASSARAGDPLTYRLQLSGSGNFDRLVPPALDLGPDWKSYPPTAEFRPGDALGLTGVKTFDYTLVPLRESITSIPSTTFSYFDPATETYRTLAAPPLPLTVLPNPNLPTPAVPAPDPAAALPPPPDPNLDPAPAASAPALRPLTPRLQPGHPGLSSLRPWFAQPLFWVLQAVPALALLGFAAFSLLDRRRRRDLRRLRRLEVARQLTLLRAEAGQAARAGDLAHFFALALRGLRLQLSRHPDFAAQALTLSGPELETAWSRLPLPAALHQDLARFLAAAEVSVFAAQVPAGSAPGGPAPSPSDRASTLRQEWEDLLQRLDPFL